MWSSLVDWLACPKCQSYPLQIVSAKGTGEKIDAGELICSQCDSRYPIHQGIPSFVGPAPVEGENIAGAQVLPLGPVQELQTAEMQFRDAHFQRSFNSRKLEITLALAELQSAKEGVCLDLGCGSGAIFLPLVEQKRKLIGIDFSWNSLQYLRAKLPDDLNVHLIHADAMALPIRPAIVNSVVSLQMLEQIPGVENRKRVVQNAAHVLKRNGLFVLSVFHYSLLKRLRAPTLRNISESVYEKEGLHKGFLYYMNFTQDELSELLGTDFSKRHAFGVETPLNHRLGEQGIQLESWLVHTPFLFPSAHILVASFIRHG
jgi:ubiquinone/menaquinone biosynthesis C-methylase UbiE/uncharacterized protein YbaR (Trm112 family)